LQNSDPAATPTRKENRMFGCHNCGIRPDPGTPYEETPCATCRTINNPAPVSRYRSDPGTFQSLQTEMAPPQEKTPVQQMVINDLLRAFAQSLRLLIGLKESRPMTYQVLDAKMQEPGLSYSDLAKRFGCRKQNIQYHLKKAVELCPELSTALLIDNRFTQGSPIFHQHGQGVSK